VGRRCIETDLKSSGFLGRGLRSDHPVRCLINGLFNFLLVGHLRVIAYRNIPCLKIHLVDTHHALGLCEDCCQVVGTALAGHVFDLKTGCFGLKAQVRPLVTWQVSANQGTQRHAEDGEDKESFH